MIFLGSGVSAANSQDGMYSFQETRIKVNQVTFTVKELSNTWIDVIKFSDQNGSKIRNTTDNTP